MIVMPANSTGWFWHCLARETRRIGHLYSPGAERGPWPWFPFALDNGAFSCWDPIQNIFDQEKWEANEAKWRKLLLWAQSVNQRALWAIVPDVPGNASKTMEKWNRFANEVKFSKIPIALAVQDGMEARDVRRLSPQPDVIAIGGSTEWKWKTVEKWAEEFPRVHLLRCNAQSKLDYLESIGIESTDGTGWNRGDRNQTKGLENWARSLMRRHEFPLYPHVCREKKQSNQLTFIS